MLFLECDTNVQTIINTIHTCVNYIQWGIPIVLIIYGTLDLGKAVIASKEDEIKTAKNLFVKRAIYAIVVFLVPFIVNIVIGIVSSQDNIKDTKNWLECWNTKTETTTNNNQKGNGGKSGGGSGRR